MESNYKVAYDAEWKKLKLLDPYDVAKRLGVNYLSENRQFIIKFLNNDYVLDFEDEVIYREDDKFRPTIDDCIIILNYLTFSTCEIFENNKWVTLKEIPNGGALFFTSFQKMSVERLIKKFGDNLREFETSSIKLGGENINIGDKGYKFEVLPKINISVVMWEGDEEFSPNASILFHPSIQHLIHIETVIGAGICVAQKLINI